MLGIQGGTGRDGIAQDGGQAMTKHGPWRLPIFALPILLLLALAIGGTSAWAGSKSLGFTGHPFGGSTLARPHAGICCSPNRGPNRGLHGKPLFPQSAFVLRKPFFYGFYGSGLYVDDHAVRRKSPFRFKSLLHNKRLPRKTARAGGKRAVLGYDRGLAVFAGKHLSADGAPYRAATEAPRQPGKTVTVGGETGPELVVTHGSGGRGKQIVID